MLPGKGASTWLGSKLSQAQPGGGRDGGRMLPGRLEDQGLEGPHKDLHAGQPPTGHRRQVHPPGKSALFLDVELNLLEGTHKPWEWQWEKVVPIILQQGNI